MSCYNWRPIFPWGADLRAWLSEAVGGEEGRRAGAGSYRAETTYFSVFRAGYDTASLAEGRLVLS